MLVLRLVSCGRNRIVTVFKPPDRVELVVDVYFGQPGPQCDSDAVPPKTVQVICPHHVQKSYRGFQVETLQQNAHGGFHMKTTQFLAVESLFRFIPCIGLGDGRQRQTHFYFGFGTARANLPNKLRLQQAISEQSVIIVTRLLYCSRRNKRKEK
jgi:hypothetical protein